MARRGDHHIGAKHAEIAHKDVCVVHQSQAKVCVDFLPEVDEAPAPVGVQRRLNVRTLSKFGEHLPQHALPDCLFRGTGAVVVVQLFKALRLNRRDFRGPGIVEGTAVQNVKHWASPHSLLLFFIVCII